MAGAFVVILGVVAKVLVVFRRFVRQISVVFVFVADHHEIVDQLHDAARFGGGDGGSGRVCLAAWCSFGFANFGFGERRTAKASVFLSLSIYKWSWF